MTVQNLTFPFLASDGGKPISISSTTFPGQHIHTVQDHEDYKDFVWLWASTSTYVDFSDPIYIYLVKGTVGSYTVEGPFLVNDGPEKTIIERGIILSEGNEVRVYIDPVNSHVTDSPISITGYVHRRMEKT